MTLTLTRISAHPIAVPILHRRTRRDWNPHTDRYGISDRYRDRDGCGYMSRMNQGIRDWHPSTKAEAEVVSAWIDGQRVVESHSIRGVDTDDWHCVGVSVLVISVYEVVGIRVWVSVSEAVVGDGAERGGVHVDQ
jgi:hypothetical protein